MVGLVKPGDLVHYVEEVRTISRVFDVIMVRRLLIRLVINGSN